MQAGKWGVSANQIIQRNRFLLVRDEFNKLTSAEKARWYAARPEWSSLLWYYNFFMLSGLMDVLGADARGAQVIKLIQNRTLELPLAGTTITHATVIDANKAVVMIWGSAPWDYVREEETYAVAYGVPVYPIWGTLNNTNISLTWSILPTIAAKISLQVIEYI